MARSILATGLPIAVVIVLLAAVGAALEKNAAVRQAKVQPTSQPTQAALESKAPKAGQPKSKALFNVGANAGGSLRPLFGNVGANGGVGTSNYLANNGIGQSLASVGAAFGAGAGGLAGSAANMLLSPLAIFGSGNTNIRPPTYPVQNNLVQTYPVQTYPSHNYRPPGYYPPQAVQSPAYYPNQQTTNNVGMVGWGSYGSNTGTLSYNQCNSLWKDALLNEATNYDDWRCSARLNADGSTSPCVLTGAIGTSVTPTVVTTGCGWTMPLFCDDSVNDIVYSLRATTPTATPATPVGYTYVAGVGTYKVHPESLTWAAAKAACEAEGAHLAVPSTSTDYSTILNQLNSAIPLHNGAWVGLSDIALEGYFQTVTGQPLCTLGQAVFNTGEPSNGGLAGPVENCIEFGLARVAVLNDVPCTTILPFVCEVTLPARLATCRV